MSAGVEQSVRRAEITTDALRQADLEDAVADPRAGARVLFCGVVRDHDHGRAVHELEYVAHPDATAAIAAAAARAAAESGVVAVAVAHRVGRLAVGEVALVAAVSSAHRRVAFEVCARLVDDVKATLPVWKRQVFADGTDEWVDCP